MNRKTSTSQHSDPPLHQGLWEQLATFDPEETARRARCRHAADDPAGRFVITFLNKEYAVDLEDKTILLLVGGVPQEAPGYLEQLCILAYLINAKDVPLSNELVGEKSLPGGDFYFRAKPHELPTAKLEDAFGQRPEKLYDVMAAFDATRREFGDASIQLFVLPRLPLTITIWAGDEEFAARATVLFDKTAAEQLPLDALGAAAMVAIKAVAEAAKDA